MSFFNTFRGRLLVVLAILLIVTLGVQYYLNLRAEQENAERREHQEKALVAGIALGFNSISSRYRLSELKDNQPYFKDHLDRVANILVIDEEWQIYDSLDTSLVPKEDEPYLKLKDLETLPPLLDTEHIGDDLDKFPTPDENSASAKEGETHAISVETSNGRWYVLVVLRSEKGAAWRKAAQELIYPLAILLTSTLITVFLVWRFTRPIAKLSDAARRVAEGDLNVRVDHAARSDEMGQLAARFNEMTAQLETARELENKLRQAEKSAVVGRLGSAIAHEIRNPLNYINLTLDHLRAKFMPDDSGKREIFERLTAQLKTEVERINQQIANFLRYSRPLTLHLYPTDIRRVVEDSMRLVEGQAGEQGVEIALNADEDLPPVRGDAETLRSVFNNLFINAVQSMPAGGRLEINLNEEDNFVRIEVKDTGSGIEAENVDKIFEPYFSTKETGTGLGLAIVKKIIDDHSGSIEVASKLKEGTVFIVKLQKAEKGLSR